MSNIASNMSRSRSGKQSSGAVGSTHGRSLSVQTSVVGFITSWADLGTSNVDGQKKVYKDASSRRAILTWNNTDTQWEITSTVGLWVTLDDFSGDAIDTDLFTIDRNDNERLTVTNGALTFDVVSGSNDLSILDLNVKPRLTFSMRMNVDYNGLAIADDMQVSLQFLDFDGVATTPVSRSAHKLSFDGGIEAFKAEHTYRNAGGNNVFDGYITTLNASDVHVLTTDFTDDGTNTSAKTEVFISGVSQASDTHQFNDTYDGIVVGQSQLIFFNDSIPNDGTVTVDNLQIKI